MNKSLSVVLALILAALPMVASADGFFALTGTVSKVDCSVAPTVDPTRALQCAMTIAPDPGISSEVTVYCLDPGIAEACNSFQAGDPVMAFGFERQNTKVVEKIGLWTTTAF